MNYFKTALKLQKWLFLVKTVKPLDEYCLAEIRMHFSTKFQLDTVKNSSLWNISNLGVCWSSVDLNVSFKSVQEFWITKIYRKLQLHEVWVEFEMKMCFLRQYCIKYCWQI